MPLRSLAWLTLLLLGACATKGEFVWVDDLGGGAAIPESYRLRAGDRVHVQVWKQPDLTTDALVRPDGRITVRLVGDVAIAGLAPEDAATAIQRRLEATEVVLDPKVSVSLVASRTAYVSVLGEVSSPGRFELLPDHTLLDLLSLAGGLTEFAQLDGIYVVRRDQPSPRVRFRWDDLRTAQGSALDYRLQDGDVIVVE
jgi:polysaccharide export outer membrane protein